MTSINIYEPDDGAELPELPPLPISVPVVCTAGLIRQAADLPQPHYITISGTRRVDFQFAPEQTSVRAITRWALRFGSIITSAPHPGRNVPETWHRADFDYAGIAVTAYAHIPAAPAGQQNGE